MSMDVDTPALSDDQMRKVFGQLNMDVPPDAMGNYKFDDTDKNLDIQVKRQVEKHNSPAAAFLSGAATSYHISEALCLLAVSSFAWHLLPAIFNTKQDDVIASQFKMAIIDNPWLIKMLAVAYNSQNYYSIRRVVVLNSLQPKKKEITPAAKEATIRSWEATYVGDTSEVLRLILLDIMIVNANPPLYARAVSHVQSSGTGKSRVHDELAKTIFYIPLNLAGPYATTFPPRDPEVGQWLNPAYHTDQPFARDRCHAFLHALLSTALHRLQDICEDRVIVKMIEMDHKSRLTILASEFRKRMAEGRQFDKHGDYRAKFYKDVIAHAEKNMISISLNPDLILSKQQSPKFKFRPSPIISQGNYFTGQNNDNNKILSDELTIPEVAKEIVGFLDPSKTLNVVICWDESHSLLESKPDQSWTMFSELRHALRTLIDSPIISVFLSTAGKFHDLSPISELDPSARIVERQMCMLPPTTVVSFDQFAVKVVCKQKRSLACIASTHQIVHLGRALFPTRFDNGDDQVKAEIIEFGADKLLCRSSTAGGDLDPDQSLACIAVRLGLDFKATSWLDRARERIQVERHMRIYIAATEGFRNVVTISPSEPLLAEGSWLVMREKLGPKEAPRALRMHIDTSYLNAGDRGEVVAALLLLLARDEAIRIRSRYKPSGGQSKPIISPEYYKSDGLSRIVTVPEFIDALVPFDSRSNVRQQMPNCWSQECRQNRTLERTFAKAHIYFNHFIKVDDFDMVNCQYLWRLICRGAAIICANNQAGVDIIIPVLMGTNLHPTCVTAVLVQVKNDKSYTNHVVEHLFMDPFRVGLFSSNDGRSNFPPVLRIVLALASERSAVTGPPLPSRKYHHDRFIAYDIWIAGVSSQSFGVIPDDDTQAEYRLLLDRTRNVFNGYHVFKEGACTPQEEGVKEAVVKSRRMLHAGASAMDHHFQNYIHDLEKVHLDDYNVSKYEDEDVDMGTR